MKQLSSQQFAEYMLICPYNKFFKTPEALNKNMEERMTFAKILDKVGDSSRVFKVTNEFVADFIMRND